MRSKRKGIALVICAPSGAGKTTLVNRLRKEFPHFTYSVSYTTRSPRKGEVEGVDYHFVNVEEFKQLRDEHFFAEWAEVHSNYYGTPLKSVQDQLEKGRDLIFDVDVQGARQLKAKITGGFVFIMPPSYRTLEERLAKRGTDDEETILRRLRNAATELKEAGMFDAWIVNDDLDTAYDELRSVFLAEKCRPHNNVGLLDKLLNEWDA